MAAAAAEFLLPVPVPEVIDLTEDDFPLPVPVDEAPLPRVGAKRQRDYTVASQPQKIQRANFTDKLSMYDDNLAIPKSKVEEVLLLILNGNVQALKSFEQRVVKRVWKKAYEQMLKDYTLCEDGTKQWCYGFQRNVMSKL